MQAVSNHDRDKVYSEREHKIDVYEKQSEMEEDPTEINYLA